MEKKIQSLQNQVNYLQDKISDLETTLKNSKYPLSDALEASERIQIGQMGDSTLKSEKSLQSADLLSNDSKVNLEVKEPRHPISESLSEDKIRPLETLYDTQQYNIPSNQEKVLHGSNFITLGKIPEQERIEIIQKGFQLQAEGKISLKKYYETTHPYSLFQLKGYSIKYESIRRTTLYKSLKES
jgi:hypothetical protein